MIAGLLAAFFLGSAAAQSYSMPTTEDDLHYFGVSAYKDHGGYDWGCGGNYYSGHNGTDIAIGGFGNMSAGIDVVAAADGTVVSANDGESDTCTTGTCGTANYVILSHADGRRTLYWHFKKWSVAVGVGDTVTCGQKLGEVGSSGNSTGPHLHFEPRTSGNVPVEPFAGSCGSSSSSWVSQGSYNGLPDIVCGSTDADGDGYTTTDDCDDTDAATHPGANEYCDGRDDDCDGTVDEDDAVDAPTWYRDAGADGYGDPGAQRRACTQPSGYLADNTDCDDTYALTYPGAFELCDGEDNNCASDIDEGYDTDADGYRTCDGDCDDTDPGRNPGAAETVDGTDEDCDWTVDEGSAVYDDDHDGWTEDDGDCDDADAFAFPDAPEVADGGDDDCDGRVDEGTAAVDDDGDGWSERAGDCDDADATRYPGAHEGEGLSDGDCDGVVDEGTARGDDDGDGFSGVDGDCDDADEHAFPLATERVNGRDDNCDGLVDDGTAAFDDDGDGYTEAGHDCDDVRAEAWPGAPELENGRDDDCDAIVDNHTPGFDDDGDGWTEREGDCDDGDAHAFPDGSERVDGRDGDCDGVAEVPEGWGAAVCGSAEGAAWLWVAGLLAVGRRRGVGRRGAAGRR